LWPPNRITEIVSVTRDLDNRRPIAPHKERARRVMVARQFNQRRSFGERGLDRSISVEVFVVVEPNYHRTVELVNVHILIDKPRQVSTAAVAVRDVDQSGHDCAELSAECIAASFPWEIRRGKLSGIEVDDRVAVARQNVRVGNIVGGRRLADAIMILHELHADGAIVGVAKTLARSSARILPLPVPFNTLRIVKNSGKSRTSRFPKPSLRV